MTAPAGFYNDKLTGLCDEYRRYNGFNKQDYLTYGVKRGLRNNNGTGVLVGLTKVAEVSGYYVEDGVKLGVTDIWIFSL